MSANHSVKAIEEAVLQCEQGRVKLWSPSRHGVKTRGKCQEHFFNSLMQVSMAERMAACTVDILEDRGIVSSITSNFLRAVREEREGDGDRED